MRKAFVVFVFLILAQGNAVGQNLITEGRLLANEAKVEDRQGDSAWVSLNMAYRLWPLMGELVQSCVAQWSLDRVRIDGQTYHPQSRGGSIPDDVWAQANLYGVTAHVLLTLANDAGIEVSMLCDLGAFGPPDGETISFNVPSSPPWDRAFLQRVFTHGTILGGRDQPFETYGMSEEQAQAYARHLMNSSSSRNSMTWINPPNWRLKLWKADINLWPIRQHIRRQNRARAGAESSPSQPLERPPASVPSRAESRQQIAGRGPVQHPRGDLSAAMDRQQQSHGSDQSLTDTAGDQTAPISGVSVPREPAFNDAGGSMILLIDTSGSMSSRNRLRDAKQAARNVIDNAVRQGTEVAVLTFSGSCSTPVPSRHPFSLDRQSLREFVDELQPGGSTPMSAAVEYTNRYMALNSSPSSRSEMIILLADGDDQCGIMSPVVAQLKSDGVLFRHQTVGLEIGRGSSAARQLRDLADESGGDYQYAADGGALNETFRRAMLAMDILDLLGRFGQEEEPQSGSSEPQSDPTQSILDGF